MPRETFSNSFPTAFVFIWMRFFLFQFDLDFGTVKFVLQEYYTKNNFAKTKNH